MPRFASKTHRIQRLVLPVFLCLFILLTAAVPAFAISYSTLHFDTQLDVQENSSMHVTETIVVDFQSPAHGIYRDIWAHNKCWFEEDGELIESEMLYKLKNFKCEGEEIRVSTETDIVSVRIGSADVTLTGRHTYVLEYDVIMYKDTIDSFDQLYWNVMPAYWQTDVERFTFSVNMPGGFDADGFEVIAGPVGTGDTSRGYFSADRTTVRGGIDGPVSSGEGVTIRLKLPEGYWKNPKDDAPKVYALMGVMGALTFFVVTLFVRHGKDPRIIRTVEFYPPDDMSPAEVGYLYDEKLQDKDMTSLVMWFASKGYLRIYAAENRSAKGKNDKYRLTLMKLQDLPEDAPTYLRIYFDALFRGGDKVRLDKLPRSFYFAYEQAKEELMDEFEGPRGLVDPRSTASKNAGCLIGILCLILMIVGCGIFMMTEDLAASLGGEFFLCAILIFICVRHMKKPSAYRTAMLGRIYGFRKFIKRAELDRINRLVEQNPDYFYSILPYAYVFGLTKRWARNFDRIAMSPPDWYAGPAEYFYSSAFVGTGFQDTVASAIRSAAPVPTGSSFSGGGSGSSSGGSYSSSGGGYSGGGGGGGGGGAW